MLIRIFFLALIASSVLAQESRDDRKLEPVQQFVQTSFYHGVPIDLARRYDRDDVPTLIAMLRSDEQKPHWGNIIWVLGAIGDERGLTEIVNFSEQRFSGDVDADVFNALIQCNLAIGLLGNRNDSALKYLQRASQMSYWRERELKWNYRTLKSDQERAILLTQLAINGLPLSAKPEATRHLNELTEKYRNEEEQIYFGNNIKESIERGRLIQAKGLRAVLHFSDDGYDGN